MFCRYGFSERYGMHLSEMELYSTEFFIDEYDPQDTNSSLLYQRVLDSLIMYDEGESPLQMDDYFEEEFGDWQYNNRYVWVCK